MDTTGKTSFSAELLLIRKASQADLDEFTQLVLIYQNMAYNHVYALLGDHDSAANATRQSSLKAFHNVGSFRHGSFRAWLLSIPSNGSYYIWRRSRRHSTIPLLPEHEDGEEIEPSSQIPIHR